jgi:RNA polymerase sigma-70 factor (ECF subfamily)
MKPATALSERQLFEAVHRRMCALAGRGASDLDDLVQLAAEQVFRSLPSFTGRSDLMTWVYAICYRVLMRNRRWHQRWRLRFSLDHEDEMRRASDDGAATTALEIRERARQLEAALTRLSDKYRTVVVLHDLEELPVKDIARIVDAGELTVRSRLRDGRKRLQKILQTDADLAPSGGQHELTPS